MAVRPEYFPGLEKRLTSVVWLARSGILFLRVQQKWSGVVQGPAPKALVTFPELNWAPFDMFTAVASPDPEDSTPPDEYVIADPVTNGMLAHWRYWPHDTPFTSTVQTVTPGLEIWVVDTALWYGYYNNVSFGAAFGSLEAATNALRNSISSVLSSNGLAFEENRFGVALAEHLENGVWVPTSGPPTPPFFELAASAQPPWTYHSEQGPDYITWQQEDVATLLVNLVKVKKSLPELPGGGKAESFTIRIEPPQNPAPGVNLLDWGVEGSAYSTRVSTPPQPTDGRRTFPCGDLILSEGAPPAAHLAALWDEHGEIGGAAGGFDPEDGAFALVTVTFGNPPTVEFEMFGAGTPSEG